MGPSGLRSGPLRHPVTRAARAGAPGGCGLSICMSRFHGLTRAEQMLGPLALTLTEYSAKTRLSAHSHARPYASLLIDGSYTEVNCFTPRLCNPAGIIAHSASEFHADYFHARGLVLNIETDEPWSLDLVFTSLRDWLPSSPLFPRHLARVLRSAFRDDVRPEQSPKTADWIDDSIKTFDWTSVRPISDLARFAGVHPTHYCRAFRHRTGMTPSGYRRRERVNSASRFLLSTGAAISHIAIECGFSDQSHFTNTFRSATGIPPGDYRRVFGC